MNRIKELRKARGLTQTELAERAGVSQQYIARLEKGNVKSPNLLNGLRLAAALGVEPEELISDTSPNARRAATSLSTSVPVAALEGAA